MLQINTIAPDFKLKNYKGDESFLVFYLLLC